MFEVMTILIALLAGALLLIGVYYIYSRDERLRRGRFVDFHYGNDGKCDYISYGGRKYYPERYFETEFRL